MVLLCLFHQANLISMKYMFLSLFIYLIVSCSSSNSISATYPEDTMWRENVIRIHTEAVQLDKVGGNYTFLNSSIDAHTPYLHFYNQEHNRIDSYDLTHGVHKNNYHLPDSHTIKTSKFAYINDSTFFSIDTDNILYRYEKTGVKRIADLKPVLAQQKLAIQTPRLEFTFQVVSDSLLYFPLHINPYSRGWVRPYDYPMTAVYNLNTDKIITTGIHYPKHYHKHDYGLIRDINQLYLKDKIIYNPQAQDEVWEYNCVTDSIYKHAFRSRYQEKEIQPLWFKSTPKTKDLLMKHSDLSACYSHLVYDPYKKVYYRFFKHARPEKGTDGFYTTYKEDLYSVIIADEDFTILGEEILPPQNFFIYFAYATPQGLIINNGSLFGEENKNINVLTITFDMLN